MSEQTPIRGEVCGCGAPTHSPLTPCRTDAETPLTAEQLAEIRARAEAATPGPWTVELEQCDCSDGYCHHGTYVSAVYAEGERRTEPSDFPDADWQFIIHARTDVPRLLAEVERLRAEVAGRVSVETAEAIWRAGVIAGSDAEESTARPSRAEVMAEVATDLETAGHELAATELREWIEAEKTMSPDMRRGLVAMMRHQELAAGRIDIEDEDEADDSEAGGDRG